MAHPLEQASASRVIQAHLRQLQPLDDRGADVAKFVKQHLQEQVLLLRSPALVRQYVDQRCFRRRKDAVAEIVGKLGHDSRSPAT